MTRAIREGRMKGKGIDIFHKGWFPPTFSRGCAYETMIALLTYSHNVDTLMKRRIKRKQVLCIFSSRCCEALRLQDRGLETTSPPMTLSRLQYTVHQIATHYDCTVSNRRKMGYYYILSRHVQASVASNYACT